MPKTRGEPLCSRGCLRYESELDASPDAWHPIVEASRKCRVASTWPRRRAAEIGIGTRAARLPNRGGAPRLVERGVRPRPRPVWGSRHSLLPRRPRACSGCAGERCRRTHGACRAPLARTPRTLRLRRLQQAWGNGRQALLTSASATRIANDWALEPARLIAHGLPIYVALEPVDMRLGYERLGARWRRALSAVPEHGGACRKQRDSDQEECVRVFHGGSSGWWESSPPPGMQECTG